MKNKQVLFAVTALVGVLCVTGVGWAQAGQKTTTKQVVNTGLLGIKLLDPHTRVLQVWGNPTRIEPLQVKQDQGTPSGGGMTENPFGMVGPSGPAPAGPVAMGPAGVGGPAKGGPPGMVGPTMGPGGIPVAGAGGPAGGTGGGFEGEMTTTVTRWVYKRGGTEYAFVIDDDNRVIQIDAKGFSGAAVAAGGIRLGSTFQQVMSVYKNPDRYDFKGGTMQLRFLNNSHVVFQFVTLNGVQRVVYISVAAGK